MKLAPNPSKWHDAIRQAPVTRLLLAALLLLLCGEGLHGGSVLDFPRLAFESGSITGVAIVNPNTEDASVALTAYGEDGSVLATQQLRIAAGRQISALTQDLFGSEFAPDTVAWFQAISESRDLTGFFLTLNDQDTELDGANLPVRARRILFNEIRVGGGTSTELNIVNTADVVTTVGLTLVTGAGDPVVRTLQLSAKGAARLDLESFFEPTDMTAEAYVLAEADEDLTGFELVRSLGADIEGLNARSATDLLNTIYFPQFRVLGPFVSQLGLTNLSDRAVIATLTAHDPDGAVFVDQLRTNPVAVSLAPGGSLKRDLAELFGFSGDESLEGWLEIRSTSTSLSGYLELLAPETGAAATLNSLAQGSTRSLFSHLATSKGVFTGVALLNPASLTADVRLAALSDSGEVLGTFDAALHPGQRISALVTELLPEADGQTNGFLLLRSSLPIFATSLFGSLQGSLLSSIGGQPAPDDFRPDDGVPTPSVIPNFALLFEGNSQTFRASQLSGDVRWLVNGIEGGNAEFGTIDGNGRYLAPPVAPATLPVVVTAVSGSRSAGASIDVVSLNELSSGLGQVQSLAFVNSLQRLFTAELNAVGAAATSAGSSTAQQGLISSIYGRDGDGRRTLLINLEGEEVPKMIPFLAADDQEYLLVSARTSGRVLRVDPRTGAMRVVADNLDAPQALVIDPVTGNLLVAEANQVSSIPRRELESGLQPAAMSPNGDRLPRAATLAPVAGVAGIAVDSCTGRIYASLRSGELMDLGRGGEAVPVMEGLNDPGQLAGFYRSGVSCPSSFQLLVVEAASDQITLVAPSEGTVVAPWAPAPDAKDIVTIPEGSPFQARVAFDMTAAADPLNSDVMGVDLPGLYRDGPDNPLRSESIPASTPPGPDLVLGESNSRPGATATVSLFYRPGSATESGGFAPTNALAFVLDYDASRLSFDPADSDGDGLPDSITPNTPSGFGVFAFYNPDNPDGELAIAIVDPTGQGDLPEDRLLTIGFQVVEGSRGTADLAFSSSLLAQGVDAFGTVFDLDEVLNGAVWIIP